MTLTRLQINAVAQKVANQVNEENRKLYNQQLLEVRQEVLREYQEVVDHLKKCLSSIPNVAQVVIDDKTYSISSTITDYNLERQVSTHAFKKGIKLKPSLDWKTVAIDITIKSLDEKIGVDDFIEQLIQEYLR